MSTLAWNQSSSLELGRSLSPPPASEPSSPAVSATPDCALPRSSAPTQETSCSFSPPYSAPHNCPARHLPRSLARDLAWLEPSVQSDRQCTRPARHPARSLAEIIQTYRDYRPSKSMVRMSVGVDDVRVAKKRGIRRVEVKPPRENSIPKSLITMALKMR